MRQEIQDRCMLLGRYIARTGATVRQAAQKFGISKSTVHKDVTDRLRRQNPALWRQVREILERNKSERHLRGGMATKEKYRHLKQITSSNG